MLRIIKGVGVTVAILVLLAGVLATLGIMISIVGSVYNGLFLAVGYWAIPIMVGVVMLLALPLVGFVEIVTGGHNEIL